MEKKEKKYTHKNNKSELIPTRYPHALSNAMRLVADSLEMSTSEFIKLAVIEKMERHGVNVELLGITKD